MTMQAGPRNQPYDSLYQEFDSPLMRRLRREAYGEDIGQHSWLTAQELREDIGRLRLTPAHRLLDLGCGPCGPLTFILGSVGCRGTGLDVSAAAVAIGRQRATSLALDRVATIREADLNSPLPIESSAFDAAMAFDVVLHVRDRAALFREVARVLTQGARFLFTDAGVVAGAVSGEEVALRSVHGYTQLAAPGFNERALEDAGLRLLEAEDRTDSLLANATGRLTARLANREELLRLEGVTGFERQRRYLETVIALARRRSVTRMMYLAAAHDG